jgi:hypothetical protein
VRGVVKSWKRNVARIFRRGGIVYADVKFVRVTDSKMGKRSPQLLVTGPNWDALGRRIKLLDATTPERQEPPHGEVHKTRGPNPVYYYHEEVPAPSGKGTITVRRIPRDGQLTPAGNSAVDACLDSRRPSQDVSRTLAANSPASGSLEAIVEGLYVLAHSPGMLQGADQAHGDQLTKSGQEVAARDTQSQPGAIDLGRIAGHGAEDLSLVIQGPYL